MPDDKNNKLEGKKKYIIPAGTIVVSTGDYVTPGIPIVLTGDLSIQLEKRQVKLGIDEINPTIYMMKGLPASGKSEAARKMIKLCPDKFIRVNRDILREMSGVDYSPENEEFIKYTRNRAIVKALRMKRHVIVDDTNLKPGDEYFFKNLAKDNGARFEVIDFTNVKLKTLLDRDAKREHSVGAKVIKDMYKQFIEPKSEKDASSK